MSHVDALSRNPVGEPQEFEEVDIIITNITESDWVRPVDTGLVM